MLIKAERDLLTELVGFDGIFFDTILGFARLDLATKILYVERALTEDWPVFFEDLDKLYHDLNTRYPSCKTENLGLIAVFKMINNLVFNSEVKTSEYGYIRSAIVNGFQSVSGALLNADKIQELQTTIKTLVNRRIRDLYANQDRDDINDQKAARITAEESMPREIIWRAELDLPVAQRAGAVLPETLRAVGFFMPPPLTLNPAQEVLDGVIARAQFDELSLDIQLLILISNAVVRSAIGRLMQEFGLTTLQMNNLGVSAFLELTRYFNDFERLANNTQLTLVVLVALRPGLRTYLLKRTDIVIELMNERHFTVDDIDQLLHLRSGFQGDHAVTGYNEDAIIEQEPKQRRALFYLLREHQAVLRRLMTTQNIPFSFFVIIPVEQLRIVLMDSQSEVAQAIIYSYQVLSADVKKIISNDYPKVRRFIQQLGGSFDQIQKLNVKDFNFLLKHFDNFARLVTEAHLSVIEIFNLDFSMKEELLEYSAQMDNLIDIFTRKQVSLAEFSVIRNFSGYHLNVGEALFDATPSVRAILLGNLRNLAILFREKDISPKELATLPVDDLRAVMSNKLESPESQRIVEDIIVHRLQSVLTAEQYRSLSYDVKTVVIKDLECTVKLMKYFLTFKHLSVLTAEELSAVLSSPGHIKAIAPFEELLALEPAIRLTMFRKSEYMCQLIHAGIPFAKIRTLTHPALTDLLYNAGEGAASLFAEPNSPVIFQKFYALESSVRFKIWQNAKPIGELLRNTAISVDDLLALEKPVWDEFFSVLRVRGSHDNQDNHRIKRLIALINGSDDHTPVPFDRLAVLHLPDLCVVLDKGEEGQAILHSLPDSPRPGARP